MPVVLCLHQVVCTLEGSGSMSTPLGNKFKGGQRGCRLYTPDWEGPDADCFATFVELTCMLR
eukprot:3043736-Amphidinium_carterae.5